MKYILDTNIFNRLLDGRVSLADLPSDGKFVATHVQRDELENTRDPARRQQLLNTFTAVIAEVGVVASMVFDVSGLDRSRWSDGQLYRDLKGDLDVLKNKANNVQDSIIAEVAIVDGLTLLTADGNLAKVAQKHGAKFIKLP